MSFDLLKEKLVDQLIQLKAKALESWESFNQREKIILSVAAAAFFITLSFYSIKVVSSVFMNSGWHENASASDLRLIQDTVQKLQSLRYEATQFDRLLSRQGKDFQMETFLENQARQHGVSLKSVKPSRAKSASAKSKDEFFEIELQNGSSLSASLKFLESVDDVLGLRILSLEMKPDFKDSSKLNVNARIAYSRPS